MKYAVIELSGQQIIVEEGRYYLINRLPQKIGSVLLLNRILFYNDNGCRLLGYPYIQNITKANVFVTILEHFKSNKITVFKMKAKKKMIKTRSSRQDQTRIIIDKIEIH